MKDRHYWALLGLVAFLMLLTLAGCGTLHQNLRATAEAINATGDTCTSLLDRDRISSAAGQRCRQAVQSAGEALALARGLANTGNVAGAQAQLELAQRILLELERTMKEKP